MELSGEFIHCPVRWRQIAAAPTPAPMAGMAMQAPVTARRGSHFGANLGQDRNDFTESAGAFLLLGVQKEATGFSESLEGALSVAGPPPLRITPTNSRSVILSSGFWWRMRCCSLPSSLVLGRGEKPIEFKVIAYGFKQDSHFVLAKTPLIGHSRAGLRTENAVREPPGSLPFSTVDRSIGRAFALPVSGSQSRRTILARLNPKQIEGASVIRFSIALFQFRNSSLQCAHHLSALSLGQFFEPLDPLGEIRRLSNADEAIYDLAQLGRFRWSQFPCCYAFQN